jgi:membrane-associated phospholipid phosphatase
VEAPRVGLRRGIDRHVALAESRVAAEPVGQTVCAGCQGSEAPADTRSPRVSQEAAIAVGAAAGFGLGAAWGAAVPDGEDAAELSGARGADLAVAGLGLATWLGPRLLDRPSPPLAQGRLSDCDGAEDSVPAIDRWLRASLAASSRGGRRKAARAADALLATALAQPFGVAIGAGPRRVERDLAVTAGTLGVTFALASGVKDIAERPRPSAHYCEPQTPGALERPGARHSFYSAHASLAFSAAFTSARLAEMHGVPQRWRVWATGLSLATAAGVLQMRADRHYFTDVAVGAVVGSLLGWFLPALHEPQDPAAHAAAPAAPNPLGFGLSLPPPGGRGVLAVEARILPGAAFGVAWRW